MKILFVTTGGTIDKVYFDAKSEYEVGSSVIPQILSESNATLDYHVEALLRKDSLDLTEDDRRAIRAFVESRDERHVVITHGTDTMAETGKFLSGIPDKTIVLTGSLTPARFRQTDAVFNVAAAIAAVQCLDPGVYITMNGKVFRPESVRKNREQNRFEEVEAS